jgi:RHS repeat-associated protein
MDTDTSLIYMQARYYDPDVGRFLSMDPKPPMAIDGTDFNRYAYARNNPYRNVDPDGRIVETVWDVANIGIGVVSFGKNVATGNYIGAVIDAVGVVVDTAAAVVPGVPGGAGAAIKAVRAADAVTTAARTERVAESASDLNKVSAKSAYSTPSQSLIPRQAGHPFHAKAVTDSTACRSGCWRLSHYLELPFQLGGSDGTTEVSDAQDFGDSQTSF